MNVVIENVLDLLESGGEVQLARDLSAFSCPQNAEIETFIRQRAIDFARRKLSITYLVTDLADGELLGYFTLAHKAIEIEAEGLSQTSRRRIGRYARYDSEQGTYSVSAFLLAQLGKNFAVENGSRLSGVELMESALDILADIQHRIGGGLVYLDAEDRPELRHFYENKARCTLFGERHSESDATTYLQYMKFL